MVSQKDSDFIALAKRLFLKSPKLVTPIAASRKQYGDLVKTTEYCQRTL